MGLTMAAVTDKHIKIVAQNFGSTFRIIMKCANLMFCLPASWYIRTRNQQDALFAFNLKIKLSSIPILPTGSQHKPMTYTNCCIYRVVPPDDEQYACSKHVEVNYWNKLKVNTISCWLLLYGLIAPSSQSFEIIAVGTGLNLCLYFTLLYCTFTWPYLTS